jgi:hypothetical protein
MASDEAHANEAGNAPEPANRLLEHCKRGSVALRAIGVLLIALRF